MKKLNKKKFQTHMCNFLFGDSVLTLNYKYYQVTSSAKTFSNSFYSWRCRSKEYPPPNRPDLGGGTRPNVRLKGICPKTHVKTAARKRLLTSEIFIKIFPLWGTVTYYFYKNLRSPDKLYRKRRSTCRKS